MYLLLHIRGDEAPLRITLDQDGTIWLRGGGSTSVSLVLTPAQRATLAQHLADVSAGDDAEPVPA
jgi:hypothetical protein